MGTGRVGWNTASHAAMGVLNRGLAWLLGSHFWWVRGRCRVWSGGGAWQRNAACRFSASVKPELARRIWSGAAGPNGVERCGDRVESYPTLPTGSWGTANDLGCRRCSSTVAHSSRVASPAEETAHWPPALTGPAYLMQSDCTAAVPNSRLTVFRCSVHGRCQGIGLYAASVGGSASLGNRQADLFSCLKRDLRQVSLEDR